MIFLEPFETLPKNTNDDICLSFGLFRSNTEESTEYFESLLKFCSDHHVDLFIKSDKNDRGNILEAVEKFQAPKSKVVFWHHVNKEEADDLTGSNFRFPKSLKEFGYGVSLIYMVDGMTSLSYNEFRHMSEEHNGIHVVPFNTDYDTNRPYMKSYETPESVRLSLFHDFPKLMDEIESKFMMKPVSGDSKGILHIMRLGADRGRHWNIWDRIRKAYVVVKFQENHGDFWELHPGWSMPNYCDIYLTLGRDLGCHLDRPFDVYPLAQSSFCVPETSTWPMRDIDFIWLARFSPEKEHKKVIPYLNKLDFPYSGILTATTYGQPMHVENPLYEEVRDMVKDNPRIKIVVDHNDIKKLIVRSRFSIFASSTEGCSKAITECLMHDVPILYAKQCDVTNMNVHLLPQYGSYFDIDQYQSFRKSFMYLRDNFWRYSTRHFISRDVGAEVANNLLRKYMYDYFKRNGIPWEGNMIWFSNAWEVAMGNYLVLDKFL